MTAFYVRIHLQLKHIEEFYLQEAHDGQHFRNHLQCVRGRRRPREGAAQILGRPVRGKRRGTRAVMDTHKDVIAHGGSVAI